MRTQQKDRTAVIAYGAPILCCEFAQVGRLYEGGYKLFIGNAGMVQVFGTRDWQTAKYISDMLGVTTRTMHSTSSSSGQGGGSSSTSFAPTQRPLVFPDELMRMDREAQILLIENADLMLADKVAWFSDRMVNANGQHP